LYGKELCEDCHRDPEEKDSENGLAANVIKESAKIQDAVL